MSSTTHDELIMGALLGGSVDRWRFAKSNLRVEHLVGHFATLYAYAHRYFTVTGACIEETHFHEMLGASSYDEAYRVQLRSEFARLSVVDVVESHFRWAVHAIVERRRDETFSDGLLTALRAMTEGIKGEVGYAVARPELTKSLALVDRVFSQQSVEGNIRDDVGEMLASYAEAQRTRGITDRTILSGLADLDAALVGVRPGENCLIAGYSSHGKTTVLQNIAWHASVVQRKNVLVLTNENVYEQYRARVFNRHTHHLPGTVGALGGIRMNDIRTGSLSPADLQVWQRSLQDFGSGDYGKLYVVQMPRDASMTWVGNQLDRFAEEFPVGVVILDYIGRMSPITKRQQRREEMNDSLALWKSLLVDFDKGRGVAGFTGYQIARERMRDAMLSGHYTLDCLAETSEAERNADVVVTVLRQESVEREIVLQVVKNRDGALLPPTQLLADFSTTLITSIERRNW